jgi:ribosomal protein L1
VSGDIIVTDAGPVNPKKHVRVYYGNDLPKISFEDDKLSDNIHAFVEQVRAANPAGVKGNYIRSVTVSATMSPGIPVTV